MIAGQPPFKAASEYLTFKKIVRLDYAFPPNFPPAARDLIERLLVLDPAARLPLAKISPFIVAANHQPRATLDSALLSRRLTRPAQLALL